MDLGTIKSKLEKSIYIDHEEFAADVRLTFLNAMLYNPPANNVHLIAKCKNLRYERGIGNGHRISLSYLTSRVITSLLRGIGRSWDLCEGLRIAVQESFYPLVIETDSLKETNACVDGLANMGKFVELGHHEATSVPVGLAWLLERDAEGSGSLRVTASRVLS
ncbi:Bromodomain [Dillenia turbinata]|uniref:Bromodomain n=1 Tax=Dillenia turbinata TaxID=194707 RepID=A0AAN8W2F7_9MAGN